ncbi:MAG: amidohydrolase family protein [Pirellulales bacterium]|nr:amidohydrolase family protein [Pirellulales bacterium]
MMSQAHHTLKARFVFPVAGPPIPGGTVSVRGERIVAVEETSAVGKVEDLGDVAILPGLVNAHAHLEFSDLRRPLGEPGMGFADWIRLVIEMFRQRPGASPDAVERGLRESIEAGTTMLGEIAQPEWDHGLFDEAQLDTTVFLELIAPVEDRIARPLHLAPRHLQLLDATRHWRPGLSPHAPYSVLPELLAAAVSLSAAGRAPLAFHLAESREELQLIRSGRGPFRDCFEELGTCDPRLFPAGGRPLDYLRALAGAHRALVIHGNYLDEEEMAFLAERAARMAVVYCPRTHAFFGHDPYPLRMMLAAGALVALGTDSRASSPDLGMLGELRFAAGRHPDVGRDVILRLATLDAAKALGRPQDMGSLEPGKYANLAVVRLPQRTAADPHELLFESEEPVVGTYYRGRLVAGTAA